MGGRTRTLSSDCLNINMFRLQPALSLPCHRLLARGVPPSCSRCAPQTDPFPSEFSNPYLPHTDARSCPLALFPWIRILLHPIPDRPCIGTSAPRSRTRFGQPLHRPPLTHLDQPLPVSLPARRGHSDLEVLEIIHHFVHERVFVAIPLFSGRSRGAPVALARERLLL